MVYLHGCQKRIYCSTSSNKTLTVTFRNHICFGIKLDLKSISCLNVKVSLDFFNFLKSRLIFLESWVQRNSLSSLFWFCFSFLFLCFGLFSFFTASFLILSNSFSFLSFSFCLASASSINCKHFLDVRW